MNDKDRLLPIKVVFARKDQDYVTRQQNFRQFPQFKAVTPALRARFAGQAENVATYFAKEFSDWATVPAVAKLTLIPEAMAKTYRPTAIFNKTTCPIIGSGQPGELFISVSPRGIARLVNRIRNGNSKKDIAHISTIQQITPFSASKSDLESLIEKVKAPRKKNKPARLRCRLFQHGGEEARASVKSFRRFAKIQGADRVQILKYSAGIRVYCLHGVPPENVPVIRAHPTVADAGLFPQYRLVRNPCKASAVVTEKLFPPPVDGVDYPITGMIVSGTDRTNSLLQAWVVDRFDYVPVDMQDNTHGSFVGGLLAHGKLLNYNHEQFPGVSSRIVDVVALDRDGEIDEYDLLTVIDQAIAKYPMVRVWNLSLGCESPCTDTAFSMLGTALDERMKKHGIIFVIAAGNYSSPPYRGWPPDGTLTLDEDRICAPANAMRGITIGGIAHLDNDKTRVRKGQPAPFGRRGPAPAFAIKPELSLPAGNCDQDGNHVQTGIVSIDGSGNIAESIGTSYPTPLAASLMSNLVRELSVDGEEAPLSLAKALLFHSAFLRSGASDVQGLRYYGIGCPMDLEEILGCRQSSATIIVQVPLTTRPEFHKRPFPMPSCLVDPEIGLQGEVFMTLFYDSPLDAKCDFEYCRCNVTASLGTVVRDSEGNESFSGELKSVPAGITKEYPNEKELVEYGYKWSPLKLYYRKFSAGPWDKPWDLRMELLTRSEFVLAAPVDVTLVITIRAFKTDTKVYDELVTQMNRLGWAAIDLRTVSRGRFRG